MRTVRIYAIPLDLKEVRIATEDGIQALATALHKPVLRLDNGITRIKGVDMGEPYSFLAVISDGVVYKWIRNQKVKNDGQNPTD